MKGDNASTRMVLLTSIALASISPIKAQQWQGNNNSTSPIGRTGNVGIGISSPASKLHVYEGDLRVTSNTASRAFIMDANASMNLANVVSFRRSNSIRWQLVGSNGNLGVDDFMISRFNNSGVFQGNAFFIQRSTGNVGIGTTTPTHRLAVNGTVRVKEVTVDTGWSDYVFSPNYLLLPLEDLADYIDRHGHLPGIPTADEVAEQGVSVGAMTAKLLEKIEELTLYTIEQDRQLRQLQSQVEHHVVKQ